MAWLFIKEKPTRLNKLWAEINIKSFRHPLFSQIWCLFFSFPCMVRIFGGPAPNDSFQVHVRPSEPGRAAAPPVSHTWDDAGLWFGGDVGGTVTPLSPLEQPQLAFWGGAWTLEAARRRRGPHSLTLPLDSTQTPISSMGTHFTLHEYCNLSLSLWHLTNL